MRHKARSSQEAQQCTNSALTNRYQTNKQIRRRGKHTNLSWWSPPPVHLKHRRRRSKLICSHLHEMCHLVFVRALCHKFHFYNKGTAAVSLREALLSHLVCQDMQGTHWCNFSPHPACVTGREAFIRASGPARTPDVFRHSADWTRQTVNPPLLTTLLTAHLFCIITVNGGKRR